MGLSRPLNFPEDSWILVVAGEAAARATLLTELDAIEWHYGGHGSRYLISDHVRDACVRYAVAVATEFAQQACDAAGKGQLSVADLDTKIEKFVDSILHHVEFGIEDQKIHHTWRRSRHSTIHEELRPKVMAKPWHRQYLAKVPEIVATLTKPAFALSPTAEHRRNVVQPLLDKLGLSPSGWATKAGVDPSVVYGYLTGDSTPRKSSRAPLSEAIGLAPDQLPE